MKKREWLRAHARRIAGSFEQSQVSEEGDTQRVGEQCGRRYGGTERRMSLDGEEITEPARAAGLPRSSANASRPAANASGLSLWGARSSVFALVKCPEEWRRRRSF